MRLPKRSFWMGLFFCFAAVGGNAGLAQSAPRSVTLTTPFNQVNLGTTVLLTGRARDDGPELNFLFYVSTNNNPADKGTLITQEAVAGCQSTLGCARTVEFMASAVQTDHFFLLEVQDESSSRTSSKIAVEVSPVDEIAPPLAPTPMVCQCGPTEVAVDAGRPMNTAVGGETLQLEASAAVTAGGGGGINPDFFQWSIIEDGGLGENLMLEDADMKSARLITPDVNQDVTVRLRFLANLSNCGCADEQLVSVLAEQPPQADLAISISDGGEPVIEKGEIAFQLSVENSGPESAPNVEVTSLIPNGASFVAAEASQGACASEGVDVVCLLGELAPGSSIDLTYTLRADADGDVVTAAVVSSGADELDIGNNAAIEITTVEAIHELFFAQFGEGDGLLFSQIILYNLDAERDSPATMFLRRDDGSAFSVDLNGEIVNGQTDILVPAGGLRTFRTDGLGEGATVGSVTVESERPLAGVILFGGAVGLAGVGSSQQLPNTFIAPMEADQASGIRTGIAVINLSADPTAVSLRLFNAQGAEVASGQTNLAGLGHRAAFLDELIDSQSVDLFNFQGLLEVSAEGPIAATVIQTRPGQFATMPVTPALNAASANSASLMASLLRGAASEADRPPLQAEPSPTVCACGGSQATVDAGPVTSSVVGGRTLVMQGAASGPASGGGGVTPGILNWSVIADAGLGSSLQIIDADKSTARLSTPDIDQDTIVTVRLAAQFEDCSCADDRFVTILGEAPPEADLAMGKEDSQDPVTATRQFEYEINLENRGPDTAVNVVVTDPLPAGVELIGAQATQGACNLDGQTVTCSLGDLAAGSDAEIILTVRADQPGLIQNVAQASSSTSDPLPNNNAASENTLVRALQTLFFAQFGEGQDSLFSQILLYNLNRSQQSQLSIELRTMDGQPISVDLNGDPVEGTLETTIPPGGLRAFRSDGSGELQSGSVRVFSDTSLAGVIIFGGAVGLAGVGSSAPLDNGFVAPMESNLAAGTRTGVAIMNLEDRSVSLTLTLIDSEGQELGSVLRPLMPQGQLAEFLDEFFEDSGLDVSNFEGLLQVETDGRIAATVIQTRPAQFATMPVSGR